jgi:hypothetical protein
MKKWYWIVVAVWCFTGLPVLLLGIGFAGGMPSLPTADTVIPWMVGWLLILAPLLLLPFGRKD